MICSFSRNRFTNPFGIPSRLTLYNLTREFVQYGIMTSKSHFAADFAGFCAIQYANGYPMIRHIAVVRNASLRDFHMILRYSGCKSIV